MPVDYQQGKVYTIRCRTDDTMIYVGSTTQSLAKRWGGHKVDWKRRKNTLLYKTISDEWDNWYIELYELYPCSCKEELLQKEGNITRLIGTLNSNIAGRTQKKWVDDNKEKIAIYQKEYRSKNKDDLTEYYKIYKNENKEILGKYRKENISCECGCIIQRNNLSTHKKTKYHTDWLSN